MSDHIEKARAELAKKQALLTKEAEIRESRIQRDYDKLQEAKRQEEVLKRADLSQMSDEAVAEIQADIEAYLDAANNSMVFVDDVFKGVVPLFPKNVILIGAASGEGKSTISANVTLHCMKQGAKILVLTNEENIGDIYNRVTCLTKDWNYQSHEQFTVEQREFFKQNVVKLKENLVVLGDRSVNKAEGGDTTTLEGVTHILEDLIEKNIKYDLIVIDYFQNVASSRKDPRLNTWEVQAKLANYLDNFKNRYQAPVIVFAQVRPAKKEDETPFEDRLKGRKKIYETCTFACEARANKKDSTTEWVIHKSRFGVALDSGMLKTGWERGRYVPLTDEFIRRQEEKKLMALVGPDKVKETK